MSTLKEDAAELRRILGPLGEFLGWILGLICLIAFVAGLGFLGFVFLEWAQNGPMPSIGIRIVE